MQSVRVGMFSVIALCAAAQASNPFLIVVSDAGGPNVKVYGTNANLHLTPMMPGVPMPGIPEEFIATTPPYLVPIPPQLAQPFGPLATGAAVCTIPLDIDANAEPAVPCSVGPNVHGCGAIYNGNDVIVIGSGPGIAPPRVQVWMNYSNYDGRAERDTFRKVVEFQVADFGPNYSSGLNVTTGDYNGDGNLDIAVGRRKGEPRVAFYTLDGSQLGPWASLAEFVGDGSLPLDPGTAIAEYVLPQTGSNELVAFPEVPADYNGGVRLATRFYYGSPLFDFDYSTLVTAPGKGFKPWVKVWFVHDGTSHPIMHAGGCCGPTPYCNPQDVALAQAYSPFVLSEFLAFGSTFKGGVNVAAYPSFVTSVTAVPQNGFFNEAVLCGQASGGGTVNVIGQTYASPSFDKLFSIKPLGDSYTGGVGVSSADRNLDLYPDILVFPASTQTGALANLRSLRIANTAQGEKIVEDTLLRFKPFGNNRFFSSP